MTTTRTKPSDKTSQRRRTPERTCVVCRSTRDKRTLVRLARSADGLVVVDPTGKGPGRGAYLCRSPRCWSDPDLARRLGRALKTSISAASLAGMAEFAATLPKDAGDGTTAH